jgi:hypothetical protein
MIQHACTEVLGLNCLDSCLPEHYFPASIQELIQNDTEKAKHGGITKTSDIDCQRKRRLISLALMLEEFFGLSLGCRRENIKEIILALNPTVEGEATASYLTDLLRGKDMVISRIAFGIPLGGDLKYIDSMTLKRSLDNRASCDS